MGNENSTMDHQKSSPTPSPKSVRPPGDNQSVQREQGDTPRSPDLQSVSSAGLIGSCSASESTASLDPCIPSSEVPEPRKHTGETREPEGSPLSSPTPPWERARPLVSMPFTERSLEGGLASPTAIQENGTLTQQLGKDPYPQGTGELGAAFTPQPDSPTQHRMVALAHHAGGDRWSTCGDQIPGISPVPPGESQEEPDGSKAQGKVGTGSCCAPESSTSDPVVTQPGKGSSAEITVPQGPVLRSSERGKCQGVASPQCGADNLEIARACHPPSNNSVVVHQAKTNTVTQESCQQQMGVPMPPTELPWHPPCPAMALDGTDGPSPSQTGTPGTESHSLVCVAVGSQPDAGSLPMHMESVPLTLTEQVYPAPSPTVHPEAQISVTTGEPSWLAREMVSKISMPISADPITEMLDAGLVGREKPASDLGGEQERPEVSHSEVPVLNPQEHGELKKREQSHAVSQGIPGSLHHLETSRESTQRPEGSKDRVKTLEDSEHPSVATEESGSSGDNHSGREEATEAPAGADQRNTQGEASQACSCKPSPQVDQEEVSKPGSDVGQSVSAQPPRNENSGHKHSPDCQLAEAAWQLMAESHVAKAATSLHKLPEEDPFLPSAPDGCGGHTVPKGPCGGESLTPSPDQPSRLEHRAAGQDIQVHGSPPPDPENSAVDGDLVMFSVKQDGQGTASCMGGSWTGGAASERPSIPVENLLQPSPLDPEVSILDGLREEAQPFGNEKEAYSSSPDTKSQSEDSSPDHKPVDPQMDARLPAHGGKKWASRLEQQHEAPKGSLSDVPSSYPKDIALESTPSKRVESTLTGQKLPALGENRPEGAGSGVPLSSVLPATADILKAAALAENLGGKESCYTGQGLNKSQQELVDAMKTASQHEEAGHEGAPPPGLDEVEMASRNTMEAPPCPPDSVEFQDAAHSLPAPEPTSPRVTPTQDAPEREVCDETQEDRQQPVPAPRQEMEWSAMAGAGLEKLLGNSPAAHDQNGEATAAETCESSRQECPRMRPAPEGHEAALSCDFIQEGVESSTSDLGEPCQAEQCMPGCQDVLLPAGELGETPRSTGDISTRGTVTESKRLLSSGPPDDAGLDPFYLQVDDVARKEADDNGAQAVSTQGSRAPGEIPCHTEELLLGHRKLSAGSCDSPLQPGPGTEENSVVQAGSVSPKAGLPLLAEGELTTEQEQVTAAPEVNTTCCEIAAGPAGEDGVADDAAQAAEHGKDRMARPSPDPRKEASGSGSSKQASVIAGLPDFREHITKIFEQSVLGTPAAERSQSEQMGAGRSSVGKDLTIPRSPEKLLEGTQGVATAPPPLPPAGLWVEKKQNLAVKTELFHPVPEGATSDKPPGLMGTVVAQNLLDACAEEVTCVPPSMKRSERPEGAGEAGLGLGVQAHSLPETDQRKLSLGHSSPGTSQGVPAASTDDIRVSPQVPGEEDVVLSGKEPLETLAGHREDNVLDCALPGCPGSVPGSACATTSSSTHGDVLMVPMANSEPGSPDILGGEKSGAATSITDTHGALEPPSGAVSDSPLEAARGTGAAEGDQGGVMWSNAETRACASGDLPETGTARLLPGVAPDSVPPGSCQDPACPHHTQLMEDAAAPQEDSSAVPPQAKGQLGPELPAPARPGKAGVSPAPEPDKAGDLKLRLLAPEELHTDRNNPGSEPAASSLISEKDVSRATSDDARGTGGPVSGAVETAPAQHRAPPHGTADGGDDSATPGLQGSGVPEGKRLREGHASP